MAQLTFQSFSRAIAATTATPFSIGVADALLVTATLSSGCTVALVDGTSVAIGNQTLGTLIPMRCTQATFAAGSLVALQVNPN